MIPMVGGISSMSQDIAYLNNNQFGMVSLKFWLFSLLNIVLIIIGVCYQKKHFKKKYLHQKSKKKKHHENDLEENLL